MAAPSHVPSTAKAPAIYQSPPRRADSWMADRPGEVVGGELTAGPGLGNQGPDQGYALKLAERFAGQLVLAAGEREDDALAGCVAVALRRASMFGRAPVVHDLRLALELFGFLDEADAELVAWRRDQFAGAAGHHGYHVKLRLADLIPSDTLRLTPAAAAEARTDNWRTPLGL
ncbi:MAG: hypothetical protein F4Y99_03865 [Acidimicrobiaceae bacterium]|nr:hypothetical protein [Acidimicrobiaceae bacterium]MDE0516878.1 hypothetical protein [Acidimicrobiaceae bacterium]MDE0655274.1 hypothetical protein [Acidimicrobiaceae bacterium]MXZ95044.1 hypothetical protein [Acidimicrobiaceae bacterium]MYF43399.1 hypothetical protein [Acidimicrobiaceae bacterium]